MRENPPQPPFFKGGSKNPTVTHRDPSPSTTSSFKKEDTPPKKEGTPLPEGSAKRTPPFEKGGLGGIFRRAPWENLATALIALGVFMLMQPFSLWLFGHSFSVILVGTVGFVIVSHFPENPG